jgi:capsular polysaccharide biosynthesis protein
MRPSRDADVTEVDSVPPMEPAASGEMPKPGRPWDSTAMARAILHRWWMVAAAAMLGVVIAVILTTMQKPLYRAGTTMVVTPSSQIRDTGDILRSLETLERRSIVATFSRIAATSETRAAAARGLGVEEQSLAAYRIQGSVVPNTNIIRIDVEGPDADMSADVANAAAEVTHSEARSLYRIYAMKTLASATAPSRPVHPDRRRNLLVGFVLGVLAGCAAAVAAPLVAPRLRRSR